jgi:glutathione S-transferase
MDDLPVLYSFRRCPYAMRARLALAVSETCCIHREVALSNKPPQLIAASAKATVPVLVLQNGEVLDESLQIMQWVLEQRDPQGWLEADGAATQALIEANDGPFKHHLDRYKYANRYGVDPVEHRAAALEVLSRYDDALSARANLCSDRMSLADAALLPFVKQYAQVDRAWFDAQPLRNLRQWLERHLSSPLFDRISLRVKPWSQGDPAILFPAPAGSPPIVLSGQAGARRHLPPS